MADPVVALDPYATVNTGRGIRVYSPGEGMNAKDILASDTDDNIYNAAGVAVIAKAFFLTVQADISFVCMDGSIQTLPGVPAYYRIDVRIRRVRSSSTTAAASTIKAIL
jgi:hypothetical protein